jgi:hypothetical protein
MLSVYEDTGHRIQATADTMPWMMDAQDVHVGATAVALLPAGLLCCSKECQKGAEM